MCGLPSGERAERLSMSRKWLSSTTIRDIHVAIRAVDNFESFHLKSLDHTPDSSDLTPSDFHVFYPLKKFLARQQLTHNDEVQAAVRRWFHSQPDESYHRGI